MKLYNQEETNSINVGGVDEKSFRKWTWLFIEATSFLEYPVVSEYYLSLQYVLSIMNIKVSLLDFLGEESGRL